MVANSFGCADTLVKPNAINIGVVKAEFSRPDTVCTGATFQLTNISTPGSFVGSVWSFGDGSSTTDVFPKYAYTVAGTYCSCRHFWNWYKLVVSSIVRLVR